MPGHASGILTPARQEHVDRYGAGPFPFSPGVIIAGASERISLSQQFPLSEKYAPLDSVDIINNSGEQILIIIDNNRARARTVPAGTIAQITNIAIRTFEVENEDSTNSTAANEINCQFSKAALTADELARRYGR